MRSVHLFDNFALEGEQAGGHRRLVLRHPFADDCLVDLLEVRAELNLLIELELTLGGECRRLSLVRKRGLRFL